MLIFRRIVAMELISKRLFTLPPLIMILALGALTILITPDTAQAGTCTCQLPEGLYTSLGSIPDQRPCGVRIPGCSRCGPIWVPAACTCYTGCAVWGIGNSCSAGYVSGTVLCWQALFVWAEQEQCIRGAFTSGMVCRHCVSGWRLSNEICVKE